MGADNLLKEVAFGHAWRLSRALTNDLTRNCFLFFCSVQPGASLEQTHIFVLAHILRRPIIVYGVKYYKSFRGETLGYTRFQGKPFSKVFWKFLVSCFNAHLQPHPENPIVMFFPLVRCLFAFVVGTEFLLEKSDCSGLHKGPLLCLGCHGERRLW